MTEYSLERFSLLVVDDNPYIRLLLTQALRAVGIGQLRNASDGSEAIELLRLVGSDPVKAGVMNFDMILSNWQMSPIDGLMLLRWVRRHKDSPNRFIPFVMVTGYADRDKVAEARDAGVTEILAKPFSVAAVAQRMVQLIERPRQFVHTATYFGPDRRRQNMGSPDGVDRRTGDTHVDIVYDYE